MMLSFMIFCNFNKVYQVGNHAGKVFKDEFMNMDPQSEIKYLGVPHAPKYQRKPIRYFDTYDYFFNKLSWDRKKVHLEDAIRKEQRRFILDKDVHKSDESFLREHINGIKEFWRAQSLEKTQVEKDRDKHDIKSADEGEDNNNN